MAVGMDDDVVFVSFAIDRDPAMLGFHEFSTLIGGVAKPAPSFQLCPRK
jgi:hypothetical protein